SGPGLSLSIPIIPIAPRPVCIGRNRRFAPGSVSEPRPAGRLLSHVQVAAARSAGSSVSSGGGPALTGIEPVSGSRRKTPHFRIKGSLETGGPEDVGEVGCTGELPVERIEQFGRARSGHRHDGLRAHARSNIENNNRHGNKEEERRYVRRIGDRERIDRRQEKEIVTQRR